MSNNEHSPITLQDNSKSNMSDQENKENAAPQQDKTEDKENAPPQKQGMQAL